MEKLFTRENLEGLLSYGWIFPITLVLLILLIHGKTIFPEVISWFKNRKQSSSKHTFKDLIYHSFFYNINMFLTVKIPLFNFKGDLGRTKIFKDMVSIHLDIFSKKIRELLDKDITKNNILELFSNTIKSCKEEQEILWKAEGVPVVVIHKFNEWNSSKLEHLLQSVKDVSNTTIIDSLVEKVYIIMNDCENYAYSVCFDGEKTLVSLNGELNGVTYKGCMLGEIKH